MKDNLKHISHEEVKLPAQLKEARRNHGGMTVPEGFFEAFEQKMNAVIDAEVLVEKAKQGPVLVPAQKKDKTNSRRWMSVAAAAVVVVIMGAAFQFDWFGLNKEVPATDITLLNNLVKTEYVEVDQIPEAVQEQVIEEMLADVNDYEIFDMLSEI